MITIAKDFSDVPWGRVPEDGEFCGENFRENILMPALKNESGVVCVSLDGLEGLGSSFLEESFGGLVRHGYYRAETLKNRLEIVANEPAFQMYKPIIWAYINDAKFDSWRKSIPAK